MKQKNEDKEDSSEGGKVDNVENFILYSELGANKELLALDSLPVVNFWISVIFKNLNKSKGYDFHYYLLIFEDTFDFKLSCKKDGKFFVNKRLKSLVSSILI